MTEPGGWGPPAAAGEGRPADRAPAGLGSAGSGPAGSGPAGGGPAGDGSAGSGPSGDGPSAPGPDASGGSAEGPRLAAALTDGEWHRLHPATPLLKGGIAFVVLLGIVLNNAREVLVESFLPGGRGGGDDGDVVSAVVDSGWLWGVVGGIVGVLLVMVLLFWISWRLHTFRVTAEVVEVRSGVLFRRERRAPLDRIQGINVQRPFLARLFGAAKLQVSQAGDDANVDLAYLRSAAADDLRREVLRRAGGAQQAAQDRARERASGGQAARAGLGGLLEQRAREFVAPELDPDEAPAESVVSMPLGRLTGSVVLSGTTLFIVAAVVAVAVSVAVTGEWIIAFALLPAVLGSSGFYVSRVTKSLRFSLASTRDGIRIGYGLLSTTNETLPPGRIHSLKVSQPLLWRPFGWWQVSINRASRSSTKGADGQANTSILPVGDEADVRRVLELVLPELVGVAAADARLVAEAPSADDPPAPAFGGHALDPVVSGASAADENAAVAAQRDHEADEQAERTLALVHAGLASSGAEGGFTTSPRRGAVLRWFSWRRNGFRTAPGAVLLRTGAVWRALVIVPLPRVQSVAFGQGPLLRRLRLARVQVHTVQGPITAEVGAIDEDDARAFFDDVARLAVEAAQADRTHRWLERASGREEGR